MQPERIQKWIAQSGYCSRRKAEKLIENKQVTINNNPTPATLGDKCLQTDIIKIDNKPIQIINQKTYIILNKKTGYITTKSDELNRKTIFQLLKPQDNLDNLFSVGRLDKDTEGLIILTNDGQLAQSIIHPSQKIQKQYLTTLNKPLQQNHKKQIEQGLVLDNYKLSKCQIQPLKTKTNTSSNKDNQNNNKQQQTKQQYIVKIYEGRKRQVRRIFEKTGYQVTQLKRIKIGNLDLKTLNIKPGQYIITTKKLLEEKIFK